jgi:hypothetical protein
MAQAPRRNIDVEQGTDYSFSFLVQDSGGSPIDLTTELAEVRMRVKTDYSLGGITVLTFSSTGTPNSLINIEPGGVTGKVEVTIPASETQSLTLTQEANLYVYDIELTLTTTGIQRAYKGIFTVYKEITTPDTDFV